MLFDGLPVLQNGELRPDLSRPGNGLVLKRSGAQTFARVPHFSRFSRSGAFPADNFRVVQSKSPTVVSKVILVPTTTPIMCATWFPEVS